jgi:glycosyltransferase involved in cell wall biosynthesis
MKPSPLEAPAAESTPKVSVLMSVQDGERYLRAAIESILDQGFADFEFLILDDASSDTSRAIIASYADPRIRLIENERNLGLTRSLNRGIRLSQGDYIARMDADDLSLPDRLQRQVDFLDADPQCAVVASLSKKIDSSAAEVGIMSSPIEAEAISRQLRRGNCLTHGSVMMRRQPLESVGLYDETMTHSQDYDLWLRLSEEHRICCIPEFLYAWRDHGDSITRAREHEQKRFADVARDKARIRRVSRILSLLDGGSVDVRAGARLVARLAREDELQLLVTRAGMGFLSRLWQRLRRSSAYDRMLVRPGRLREARRVLREYGGGGADAENTRSRLLAIIEGSPAVREV